MTKHTIRNTQYNMEVITMKKPIAIGLLVLSVIISGCAGGAEETPTPEVEIAFTPVVSITGEMMPAAWATLSTQAGGTVVEVLVEPGDEMAAGDLLVRLDPTDAKLAVQQAEAALETAQAQLALLRAGPRSEEIAAAEAQLEAARAVLAEAAAQRDYLKAGAADAEIAAAQAQLAAAQAEQWVAREAHDETMECYYVKRGGVEHEICPALGTPEEHARHNLYAADTALAAAQARLDELLAGANADQVRAAEASVWAGAAQRDVAQAQLDLLLAGVTDEELAVTEATVSQAQAVLDTARAALERCELHAPFDSTVGAVDVRMGELVVPGQPLIAIGDLTTLRVETTDLDEIDVARVTVGQQATITFDAIPEQVFTGHVTRISPMAEPGAGGVNYTVTIELDETNPAIRWGMTAFVDIEVEQ
jgi:HlyD family secretion protein